MKQKTKNAANAETAWFGVNHDIVCLLDLLSDACVQEAGGYELARDHSGKMPTWSHVGDVQRMRHDLYNIVTYFLGEEMADDIAEAFTDVNAIAKQ